MSRKRRILGSLTAVLAVTVSLFVVTAGPASAGDITWCNSNRSSTPENYHYIVLPALGYDRVSIDLCAARTESPSQRLAFGTVDWNADMTRGKAFNSFKLTVRLERADRVELTRTCDLTSALNSRSTSSLVPRASRMCKTAWFKNAPKYKWTGDGVVKFDIYGDGKGTYTWNLRGSPEIY